jgi:hypothetical protein
VALTSCIPPGQQGGSRLHRLRPGKWGYRHTVLCKGTVLASYLILPGVIRAIPILVLESHGGGPGGVGGGFESSVVFPLIDRPGEVTSDS